MYIHYFSYHNTQVKSNIIVNLVIRALRICDPCFLDKEINHIYSVFQKLGYPKYFIDKAVSRAKRNFYNPRDNAIKNSVSKNTIVLPFHHKLSSVKDFMDKNSRNCKSHHTSLSFSYPNSINSHVARNKEKSTVNNVGVYSTPCKDCNCRYYGETGRQLDVRLEEHRRDCRIGSQTSMVAKHTLELSHRINWAGADMIYKENHVGRRRVVKGALIQLLETFENNKSFTQEDVVTNILICKSAKINLNSLSTAPTAQAFSLSYAQVLADVSSSPSSSTGTETSGSLHPAGDETITNSTTSAAVTAEPRRSRRIAVRNSINTGIT